MKNFLIFSILIWSLFPVRSFAAMQGSSRTEVRRQLESHVADAKKAKNVKEWISSARMFSSVDKGILLELPNLPQDMPTIKRRFNDSELVITVDGIDADFANAGKGELLLNGEKIFFDKSRSLADTFQIISRHLDKSKRTTSIFSRWLSTPLAQAEAIKPTCIESKYEFMMRSPTALLESNFGYVGRLFVAGLVVSAVDAVTGVFANCEAQIADIKKILVDNKLGIKGIDCGSDAAGTDRNLEFWIPEADEKGVFKTRTFNLDFALALAQEGNKDDEEEEHSVKKNPELYIFGTSDLQEVRTRKVNVATNAYYCESSKPGSEQFEKYKQDIEPFRKVFEYVGGHNTCNSCFPKMLRDLRTPNAPKYFPVPVITEKAPVAKDDEEEDEVPAKKKKHVKKRVPIHHPPIMATKRAKKKSPDSSESEDFHSRPAR
ncbi:MAG: hypothetical protein ACXWQO_00435 [Bdellovibrionota bacterium]